MATRTVGILLLAVGIWVTGTVRATSQETEGPVMAPPGNAAWQQSGGRDAPGGEDQPPPAWRFRYRPPGYNGLPPAPPTVPQGDFQTASQLPPPVHATRTGPSGQTWTWDRTYSDDGTQYQYRRAFTGPQGQTHEYEQSYDGQTWSTQRTMTGPNGQTRTFQTTQTGDDVSIERTMTGPNGQTRTFQRTADGQLTIDRTGPQPSAPAPTATRPAPLRRSGFTLGSSGRAHSNWQHQRDLGDQPAQANSPGARMRFQQRQEQRAHPQFQQHTPPGLGGGNRK